jgi:TolB-like protein/tRNA A-37 threonylcarbamoyl transferase component Bud32/Flp pilus assembly protein TadD
MQEQLQAGLAQRYLLQGEVGRGAMATIYRVHDRKHNRAVAVKVLDPELAATMGSTRFLREIKIAAGLQHPHILPVYDSGETAGFLWFTMPYVEGESLRDLLTREKRLSTGQVLTIACEVAEALDYAHRHGVLHRDIKPDNIMLSEGHAMVADFGVARPAEPSHSDVQITGPGLVVGTPAYMAPEQAMGDPIDARSDLYSLGIVIYEMLAGSLPMPDKTSELLEVKRLSGERQTLPPLGGGVPAAIRKIVRKALAPIKDERYQSGAEFSRALRSELARTRHPGAPGQAASSRSRLYAIGVAFVLATMGFFAWKNNRPEPGAAAAIKRIAVLPFVNLNQAEEEYFAEGITDDIRGKLAALPGMQVTARSSSQQSGGPIRPREIGRELDVEYLLTGTVRWEKSAAGQSRVQVSPELVETSTGTTMWQQSFEAPLDDVFQVQADIAGQVALALDVALAVEERERLAQRPTGDLTAYDLFLRGRHAFHRRKADGLNEARGFFEEAIVQDPQFARAYAGLAEVYVVLPFWIDVPPSQTHPRAVAAATEALRLDSTLGEAHAALADARALYEWNWTAAERGFRQALRLDPSNANTHHWYGQDYLIVVGRHDEAIREGRRARALDPLSPVFGTTLAQTLSSSRRYDEALALADDILAVDPQSSIVQETRGRVLLHTGKYQLAVEAFERNVELSGNNAIAMALLGYAYSKVLRTEEAQRILSDLESVRETGYTSGTALAILHAGLGDTTRAFQWLDTAAKDQDPFLIYFFVVDPILDGLRKSERGKALLGRMNLGPPS